MTAASDIAERIALAPISWGVCEVPDWGVQLPIERVLTEMSDVGVVSMEFGPDGFLPTDPRLRARTLEEYGMRAIGGFFPVVLHDSSRDPAAVVRCALETFQLVGARRLVLSADTGGVGYDGRPELSERQWAMLLDNLEKLAALAEEHGIVASIHPHIGTMIESRADVDRILDQSTIGLCLDTGHLLIGGTDPVALATEHADRVTHVHLKDVRHAVAEAFRRGELTYMEAVRRGMYAALGDGDIDVAQILAALEAADYNGYYVLEQDTILDHVPSPNAGPIDDVRRSLEFITSVTHP